MRTPIEILVKAIHILANDIQSDDGVANAAIYEAAQRLEEQNQHIKRLEEQLMDAKNKHAVLVADVVLRDDKIERIKQLEAVTNDPHALWVNWLRGDVKLPVGIGDVRQYEDRIKQLEDRIHRASMAFFRDGSDGHVASQMLQILEEERGKV